MARARVPRRQNASPLFAAVLPVVREVRALARRRLARRPTALVRGGRARSRRAPRRAAMCRQQTHGIPLRGQPALPTNLHAARRARRLLQRWLSIPSWMCPSGRAPTWADGTSRLQWRWKAGSRGERFLTVSVIAATVLSALGRRV